MATAGLWALLALLAAAWGRASANDAASDAASCTDACLTQCWQTCGPLQANRSLWGTLCAADPECAAACRRLCGTAAASPPPPPPQAPSAPGAEWLARLLAALTYTGGGVRPRTASSTLSRRGGGGLWATIVEVEAPPASSADAAGVVLVDPGGLRGPPSAGLLSQAADVLRGRGDIYDVTYGDVWSVGVASVTHEGVLVFAELSWRAPEEDMAAAVRGGGSPLYLVTWEVDGGGITGNLYTDSSCVTLSLWADTVFHIQVELVRHSAAISRSSSLRIDTGAQRGEEVAVDSSDGGAADADVDAPSVERLLPQDAWLLPALPNAAAAAAACLIVACWRVRRRYRKVAAAQAALVGDQPHGAVTVKAVGAVRLQPVGAEDLCV